MQSYSVRAIIGNNVVGHVHSSEPAEAEGQTLESLGGEAPVVYLCGEGGKSTCYDGFTEVSHSEDTHLRGY
jgi:hypothetical protein